MEILGCRELVLFLLYHQFVPDFDRSIAEAHQRGHGGQVNGYYDRFAREMNSCLDGIPGIREPNLTNPHLFAVFFQIRRAFYHTFLYFIGSSKPATDIRARI